MEPSNLEEFAQALLIGADNRQADYGREILELIISGERLDELEPIIEELDRATDCQFPDNPEKALERLVDRNDLLTELEATAAKAGRSARISTIF